MGKDVGREAEHRNSGLCAGPALNHSEWRERGLIIEANSERYSRCCVCLCVCECTDTCVCICRVQRWGLVLFSTILHLVFHLIYCVYTMHVCEHACICPGLCMEVRGQLSGVVSSPSSMHFQGLNADHQACSAQALLLAEPSC